MCRKSDKQSSFSIKPLATISLFPIYFLFYNHGMRIDFQAGKLFPRNRVVQFQNKGRLMKLNDSIYFREQLKLK